MKNQFEILQRKQVTYDVKSNTIFLHHTAKQASNYLFFYILRMAVMNNRTSKPKRYKNNLLSREYRFNLDTSKI